MADLHRPLAYFTGGGGGGVRCSCGEDFAIGMTYPDTAGGKPSKKRVKRMRDAWALYRSHWQPGSEPPPFSVDTSDPWEVMRGITLRDIGK